MNWTEYKEACKKYAQFPEMDAHAYLYYGYWNEVGEVFGVLKKYLRGDFSKEEFREKLKAELGDVMWYLAMIENIFDSSISMPVGEHKFFNALINYTFIDTPKSIVEEISCIADDYLLSMEEIMDYNIQKLEDRLQRNVIKGSGDNR